MDVNVFYSFLDFIGKKDAFLEEEFLNHSAKGLQPVKKSLKQIKNDTMSRVYCQDASRFPDFLSSETWLSKPIVPLEDDHLQGAQQGFELCLSCRDRNPTTRACRKTISATKK